VEEVAARVLRREQAGEAEVVPALAADSRWPFPAAGALEAEEWRQWLPQREVGRALASSL